jgi:hypothetical protein
MKLDLGEWVRTDRLWPWPIQRGHGWAQRTGFGARHVQDILYSKLGYMGNIHMAIFQTLGEWDDAQFRVQGQSG